MASCLGPAQPSPGVQQIGWCFYNDHNIQHVTILDAVCSVFVVCCQQCLPDGPFSATAASAYAGDHAQSLMLAEQTLCH